MLQTGRQSNKQTNAIENTLSLSETIALIWRNGNVRLQKGIETY